VKEVKKVKKNKRFAVLQAGRANPNARERLGDPGEMFISLLAEPSEDWDVYDVEHGVFPEEVSTYDGFVITGSRHSVYEDLPWIRRLLDLVREIYRREIRLIGVCFGHQAIATALGGKAELNPKGWEIGIVELSLTEATKGLSSFRQVPNPASILVSHMDAVTRLPDKARHLAFSARTEYEMFTLGDSVLSLQGHPEYDRELIEEIIDLLAGLSILPPDRAEEGRASLTRAPERAFFQGLLRRFLQGSGL
jgi:GMP synthase-like glutamine amidotransferase